ncbi:MAG: malto-oligosyltrehalose synthase [Chitinivibrionales bacterium]|nr:malto-oligosyltrehalose synthase [Chitinivibrionales bacterium]
MIPRIPVATYRIQFTPQFTFRQARSIIGYLADLGISHIYASPVFASCPGSMHGYDVCDPNEINPELGGWDELVALIDTVHAHGMGWIQDIVPNHMAFDHRNPMLHDVLQHGPNSKFFRFFDIDWDHPYEYLHGKVLAPFLGKPYGQCLQDGDLHLVYSGPGFSLTYYDKHFPVRFESYWLIFGEGLEAFLAQAGDEREAALNFAGLLYTIKNLPADADAQERFAQTWIVETTLHRLYIEFPYVNEYVQSCLDKYDVEKHGADAVTRLDELHYEQYYRLSFWKVAAEELNYRRFFTISDLIAIKVEDPEVFANTHKLIIDLVNKGMFDGLRIDHIDGLFNPAEYILRLRQQAPNAYIVIEKILEQDEVIPDDWLIQGTTGYDSLTHINRLFCNNDNRRILIRMYNRFAQHKIDFDKLVVDKKRMIIGRHMAGDIDNIAHLVRRISGSDIQGRDVTMYGLKRALVEFITHFPVYRTYTDGTGFRSVDKRYIREALGHARRELPQLVSELAFLERFYLLKLGEDVDEEIRIAWTVFIMRCQQYTGPLMAKGIEDTAFYIYNPLVSLNEVGGWPASFGLSVADFHRLIARRKKKWPHAMNTTATHDTKRGEDTRARINALSCIPEEWYSHVRSWAQLNRRFKKRIGSTYVPASNEEYLYYQTLVGVLPFDGTIDDAFVTRIKQYMLKAMREAKVYTAWIEPDTNYENALIDFIEKSLDANANQAFINSLLEFHRKIVPAGIRNSLAQVVLKCTIPGVPDFYRGTELWDFSLVDPDNRRSVDYEECKRCLGDAAKIATFDEIESLLRTQNDPRIKFFIVHKCLRMLNEHRTLFHRGDYQPLSVQGVSARKYVAFARIYAQECALVVIERFPETSDTQSKNESRSAPQAWIDLSDVYSGEYRNVLLNETIRFEDKMPLCELMGLFPFGIFIKTMAAPDHKSAHEKRIESPDSGLPETVKGGNS